MMFSSCKRWLSNGCAAVAALILLAGCASTPPAETAQFLAPFDFAADTFAFENELRWVYSHDPATGKTITTPREPAPEFSHRCFPVALAAKKFHAAAEFAPDQPKAPPAVYHERIRQVLRRNPRQPPPESKILFPGYTSLRELSADYSEIIQDECGFWDSYLQRGHWRMLLPFSRRNQERLARRAVESVAVNRPLVVHIVRFPSLAINHAALMFAAEETADAILFSIYDPNDIETPGSIVFRRSDRTFYMPANDYFTGGRVDLYEIYHAWNY